MQDNRSIYNIYFRIEAGYNGGYMNREQHERFYTEIRKLFADAGFRIEDRDVGGRISFWARRSSTATQNPSPVPQKSGTSHG